MVDRLEGSRSEKNDERAPRRPLCFTIEAVEKLESVWGIRQPAESRDSGAAVFAASRNNQGSGSNCRAVPLDVALNDVWLINECECLIFVESELPRITLNR